MPSLLAPPDEWVRQLDAEVQNARGGTMPFSKFRGLRDGGKAYLNMLMLLISGTSTRRATLLCRSRTRFAV